MPTLDHPPGTSRRHLLRAGLALAGAALTPAQVWAQLAQAGGAPAPLPARMRQLLERVCDLTIPDTATPGAVKAGVPDFIALALQHGLARTGRPPPADQFSGGAAPAGAGWLDWLGFELDLKAGGNFLAAKPAAQTKALSDLDAAAYAKGGEKSPWRTWKGLIVTGYYTSEIGGSQELFFELVPGRFDPDIPVGPNDRAWSNDWTAVDFG
ncbi:MULTISPECIES: gluconate 2-dehydrogenase subunit 3 family protein [unclassified Azospirillum]|uniref:gluconate 2-dehydrogenase subunit 3 family protein n=1 Tax=unclassified Azospirillum TaxID=2630922 RepID=UPI000B68A89B|nr:MULTISPECIES: gluconate 2-dehydrogenase subunit 3 family protein [unclassified Azospirillum]SNS50614.1 Gluconate 2-dehydrogenase subunit 3 [Azospirillum sp. RU38E]SNS71068.1 Gluconate 2-dehydrogenase subunit 3 [Azospirillum sp. RU37A]